MNYSEAEDSWKSNDEWHFADKEAAWKFFFAAGKESSQAVISAQCVKMSQYESIIFEQLQAKNAELEKEVARLSKLAYIGEHQFEDNTWKHRVDELRQQLAIAEEHNARLREALDYVLGCWERDCVPEDYWKERDEYRQLVASPTSTDALDAYVAEKVKEKAEEHKMATLLRYEQTVEIARQRDLAISAATKARNAAQQCASVCSKHLDVYRALLNMIDVVDGALSAINESEV